MEDFEEFEEEAHQQDVDKVRRELADQIALRSHKLIEALFDIVEDGEVEAKVKLTAISMLLDRGVPKLGVDHTKIEPEEESDGRKALREEIERLMEEDDE